MTTLISIIISAYNNRQYLERCIKSAIGQTYQNLEIIIVDDGSTDGSAEICDSFASKDYRIKVIHQKNQGLSVARNTGVKHSTGKYLTFVDGDDFIYPECIEYLNSLIGSTKMSICAQQEISLNGKKINHGKNYRKTTFDTAACFQSMLQEEGFNLSSCGKLYHRNLFKSISFPVGHIHEDVGTTYQLVAQCPQISYGPRALYAYCKNNNSITTKSFSKKKLDLIIFTDKMCDFIDKKYPQLINYTRRRRMQARFSILRQLVVTPNPPKQLLNQTIKYLKDHRAWILKNPNATKRDILAMRLLILGKTSFKYGWQIYSKFRK